MTENYIIIFMSGLYIVDQEQTNKESRHRRESSVIKEKENESIIGIKAKGHSSIFKGTNQISKNLKVFVLVYTLTRVKVNNDATYDV